MPYSSIDEAPPRVKAFWKNIGASSEMKSQWLHVFNSCLDRGLAEGRCFRQANSVLSARKADFIQNAIVPTVGRTLQGNYGEVVQFPAILTREGVQNGYFKDFEELKLSAWTANGIPVTQDHPRDAEGYFINAQNLEELRGYISDARADAEDRSVKGMVNIFNTPENRALINSIQSGERRDGSVGFFTDEFKTDGEFKGVKYIGIEINIAYDHYAILPTGHGACSSADRCGLGLNMTEAEKLTVQKDGSIVIPDAKDTVPEGSDILGFVDKVDGTKFTDIWGVKGQWQKTGHTEFQVVRMSMNAKETQKKPEEPPKETKHNEEDCPCKDEKKPESPQEQHLNTIIDNNNTIKMADETKPESTKPEQKVEPKPDENISVLTKAIDTLKSERDVAVAKVNELEETVKKFREKEDTARMREVETLRKKVLEQNIQYRLYEDESLIKMDEDNLKVAARILGWASGSKKDFRTPNRADYRLTVPEGFTPLTIGDLKKNKKTGE